MSKPSRYTLAAYHQKYKGERQGPAFLRRCARMARREAGIVVPVPIKTRHSPAVVTPDWLQHVNSYLDKLLASPMLAPYRGGKG